MALNINIRPMTVIERMYCYTQSEQIMAQTGCIGHLRADMDRDGNGFFSSWDNHRAYLKTDAFKKEFDEFINALRFDKQYGDILKNRNALTRYCYAHREAAFDDNMYTYGFRADTGIYTYMLRLDIRQGVYNLYCYCYKKDWLDQHLQNAEQGIRFIDPDYNTLFTIPDGGHIVVCGTDGTEKEILCRFIDNYHFEAGYGPYIIYHICEFAERNAAAGNTVKPKDGEQ